MKKSIIALISAAMLLALCGCSMGSTNTVPETEQKPATEPVTEPKKETEPTTPTLPPLKPNVPDETEGRGSTDDTTDETNETLPEEIDRMRRRLLH